MSNKNLGSYPCHLSLFIYMKLSLLYLLPPILIAQASWMYPFPLPTCESLMDYLSGLRPSSLGYSAGDGVFGSFEPSDALSLRCALRIHSKQ
jgi:hypothetical protein